MLRTKQLLVALLAALTLSACTIYLSPAQLEPRAIVRFEPERGAGASYRSGQPVSFRLVSERRGYVSLVVTDPGGSVYVLGRNLWVDAGDNRLTGVGPNTRFVVVPPLGLHEVRAYFSERTVPAPARGVTGLAAERDIRRYALDVAETHLYVTRP
jgi:hypothetical protein